MNEPATDPSSVGDWLDDAMRRRLTGEEAKRFLRWLDHLDDDGWAALLARLEPIAASVAPRYRDVADPDDALGELSLMAVERWLPRFREELRAGGARASLESYLQMRLRAHLAELRRRRRRRQALLRAELGPEASPPGAEEPAPEDTLFVRESADPLSEAFLGELVRKAGADPESRAVLALRYAGFSQKEIAGMLGTSRPTITRRVAAIAAVVAGLVALLALAWAWRGGEEPAPEIVREPERRSEALPPTRPAGGGPAPLADHEVPGVVARERAGVQACYERSARRRGAADRQEIVVRLDIAAKGTVDEVHVTGGTWPGLRDCIRERAARWRFRELPRPAQVDVPFTFEGSPEPGPEPEAGGVDDDAVRACVMGGDNVCVIRMLEGRARTEHQLAWLIEAYRARAQIQLALRHMRTYVSRYPGSSRANQYRQILARQR